MLLNKCNAVSDGANHARQILSLCLVRDEREPLLGQLLDHFISHRPQLGKNRLKILVFAYLNQLKPTHDR